MTGHPYAQWFEDFGSCMTCGRRAAGILRDDRNGNIGKRCQSCAKKEIAAAHRKHKAHLPDARLDSLPPRPPAPAETAP